MQSNHRVLVTGGCGYIGSHCVWHLLERGFKVAVLDTLENGNSSSLDPAMATAIIKRDLQADDLVVYKGSTGDVGVLEKILSEQSGIVAVINFAAYLEVNESTKEPLKYYRNNTANPTILLDTLLRHGVKYFIQSSTAAVYGEVTSDQPIDETLETKPINAYGASKLMFEKVLEDTSKTTDLRFIAFRYFNVCGSHPSGLIGESRKLETHLIPLVLFAALGVLPKISIFGEDYPTRDGTCVRDYVDVQDLARGHVDGLLYLINGGASQAINFGTNTGLSVKEIIDEVKLVTQRDFPVVKADRRQGDPAFLVASNKKAKEVLNWSPQVTVKESIGNAWKFMQNLESNKQSLEDTWHSVKHSHNRPRK